MNRMSHQTMSQPSLQCICCVTLDKSLALSKLICLFTERHDHNNCVELRELKKSGSKILV